MQRRSSMAASVPMLPDSDLDSLLGLCVEVGDVQWYGCLHLESVPPVRLLYTGNLGEVTIQGSQKMIIRRTWTSTSFCSLCHVFPRQTMKRLKPHEYSRVSQQHVSCKLRAVFSLLFVGLYLQEQTAGARIASVRPESRTRSAGQTIHELWQHSAITTVLQSAYAQACLFSLIMFIVGHGTGSSWSICHTRMGRHH